MSNRQSLKPFVRGIYDEQKLRIQIGNRIVANVRSRMGQKAGESEDTMDAEGKKLLHDIRVHFNRLADAFSGAISRSKWDGDEVISDHTELALIRQYNELLSHEERQFASLGKILEDYPIWTDFMKGVKGCGPAMAGVIISEIDISKSKYPSSLWKYAGLDVASDGRGRSRRKEHLEESDYTSSEGEQKTKMGITFNPFLKTKLVGVLGSSFMRAGDNKYSAIYRDYRNRIDNHPAHAEKSKGHRHNMAIRYMIKIFLTDLYVAWRTIEGLPVSSTYQEAKLGHKHAA